MRWLLYAKVRNGDAAILCHECSEVVRTGPPDLLPHMLDETDLSLALTRLHYGARFCTSTNWTQIDISIRVDPAALQGVA